MADPRFGTTSARPIAAWGCVTRAAHIEPGMKFGRLTIASIGSRISVGSGKTTRQQWWCSCECGVEKMVPQIALVTGGTASCGCLRKDTTRLLSASRAIDLSGQSWGMLKAIRRGEDQRGRPQWVCLCACGKETTAKYVGNEKRMLDRKSCGCATSALRSLAKTKHGAAARGVADKFYRLWVSAKARARDRAVPFELDFIAFRIWAMKLLSDRGMACPILGIEMRSNAVKRGPDSMTLDRVQPALGYVIGNLDLICHRANQLKNDATIDEVARVLQYMKVKVA